MGLSSATGSTQPTLRDTVARVRTAEGDGDVDARWTRRATRDRGVRRGRLRHREPEAGGDRHAGGGATLHRRELCARRRLKTATAPAAAATGAVVIRAVRRAKRALVAAAWRLNVARVVHDGHPVQIERTLHAAAAVDEHRLTVLERHHRRGIFRPRLNTDALPHAGALSRQLNVLVRAHTPTEVGALRTIRTATPGRHPKIGRAHV